MVQETNSLNSLDLKNQVECSLNALVELRKGAQKRRVLIDNGESIFLQVVIFKVPELDEIVKRRISLKYPVWAGVPDVCLIVRDFMMGDRVKRTNDEMIDITVEKYQDLLEKHKVTGITNVMPYHQLKTEYDTYELRKKLINRFDIFLCDSYLHSREHFFDCLGKIFIEKNKFPIAVKLPKLKADYDPMVNKRIASAIASTVFYIKPSSDNYSIRIGNTLNEKEEIIENLNIVIDKILNSDDLIPGGIKNIRSLHVKTEKSKAVPIYMSLSNGNDIPVPLVKPNVPVFESVEDEISTLPGKKVTVLPSGEVFVTSISKKKTSLKNKDGSEAEQEEEEEDEDEEEEEEEEMEEKMEEELEKKIEEKKEEVMQQKKEEKKKKEKEVKEVKEKKEEKEPKGQKRQTRQTRQTRLKRQKVEKEVYKSKKRVCKTSAKKPEKVQMKKESPKKKKTPSKKSNERKLESAIESREQKYLKKLKEKRVSEGKKETDKQRGTKRKLKDEPKPLKKAKRAKVLKTTVKRRSLNKTKNITKPRKVK